MKRFGGTKIAAEKGKHDLMPTLSPNACNMVMVRLGREARVKGLPTIITPMRKQ